jgi:hypothetical protein
MGEIVNNYKKVIIAILCVLIMFLIIFIIYPLRLEENPNPLAEDLPTDFPVHPLAVEEYSYTSGVITQYTFNVPLTSEEVKEYYDKLNSEIWLVERDWFEQGDGIQKHFKTKDYNPKPEEKKGRAVQVVISQNEVDNTTKLVIVATINTNIYFDIFN